MQLQTWPEVLTQSFQELWVGVVNFLPNIFVAIIIVIVGWAVGVVIGKAVEQLIHRLKLDTALDRAGIGRMLDRMNFELNSGLFVGGLVKWFIIVAFLVPSFEVLGLVQVNQFLQEVVLNYLPQVFVAVLILLVAAVVADFAKTLVSGSARAAHLASAQFLGRLTHWAIWVFGILAALFQLGVAATFIQTLFTGIIVALSLAFGLAFGLGGQKAAADYLESLKSDLTRRE